MEFGCGTAIESHLLRLTWRNNIQQIIGVAVIAETYLRDNALNSSYINQDSLISRYPLWDPEIHKTVLVSPSSGWKNEANLTSEKEMQNLTQDSNAWKSQRNFYI